MMTLLSFAAVILIVVTIHEFGHYLAARAFGARVLRFSVGFGSPLWMRRDRHGTEWVIAPIPLGGYVRMLDRDLARAAGLPESETIEAQSHWRRIVIYAAGPAANIVLSALVMSLLLADGQAGLRPVVGEVAPAGAAAAAGVRAGDALADINGRETRFWPDVELAFIDAAIAGEDIVLTTQDGLARRIPKEKVDAAALETGIAAAMGVFPESDFVSPKLAVVSPDSAAAAAGLRVGDDIVAADGAVVDGWRELVAAIENAPGRAMELIVWREGAGVTLTATLSSRRKGRREMGYLGVSPTIDQERLAELLVTVNYSPGGRLVAAVAQTAADARRILGVIGLMLGGHVPARQVSGPVGIAVQSGEAAQGGINVWLRFLAVISTSLAVFNLLPLPVLDGGQILLSMIQCAARRDIPESLLRWWNVLGVALVLMLALFAVVNDILYLL